MTRLYGSTKTRDIALTRSGLTVFSYQFAFKEVIWGEASLHKEVPPDLTLLNAHWYKSGKNRCRINTNVGIAVVGSSSEMSERQFGLGETIGRINPDPKLLGAEEPVHNVH